MRRIIKLGVLGLAALGAVRAYELLKPKVDELRGNAGTAGARLHEVADTARVAADDVRQDVKAATSQVTETARGAADDVRQDLKAATSQVKDDLAPPVEEAKMAVADTIDVTTDTDRVSSDN